jgi:hypothetical protein
MDRNPSEYDPYALEVVPFAVLDQVSRQQRKKAGQQQLGNRTGTDLYALQRPKQQGAVGRMKHELEQVNVSTKGWSKSGMRIVAQGRSMSQGASSGPWILAWC